MAGGLHDVPAATQPSSLLELPVSRPAHLHSFKVTSFKSSFFAKISEQHCALLGTP